VSDPGSFPPPPPPSLTPPPGAVGYESTAWNRVPLKRVGGLAKALSILLAVVGVAQLLTLALVPGAVDAARDFVSGSIDEDEFTERQLPMIGVGSLVGLATIAVVVLTMIWLFRIAANHRALGRRTTFAPGWAIGGWFLPPLLYIIPTLMIREQWKAAETSSPPGDEGWRRSPEPVLVWVWFLLYSIIPIILLLSGQSYSWGSTFSNDAEDMAERTIDTETGTYLSGIITAASAVAWLLVVRALTARHRRLTGEAA